MREAIFCGCMAALALTLAAGMVDMGKYRRQMRILFTAVMLTAVLRPLAGMRLPAMLPADGTAGESAGQSYRTAQEIQEEAVALRTRTALNQALAEQEVPCEVLAVDVHIQADGRIEISGVTIAGNIQTGTVFLREWLGEQCVIRNA